MTGKRRTFDFHSLFRPQTTLDPELERRFQSESNLKKDRFWLVNCLIGIFLYASFIINDYLLFDGQFYIYFILRIMVGVPGLLLSLYFAWKSDRYIQIAMGAAPVITNGTIALMVIVTDGGQRLNYLYGIIIGMTCVCVLTRPRFKYLVGSVAVQSLFYASVFVFSDAVPQESMLLSILYGICGIFMTIVASYIMEQANRRDFVLRHEIELLNAKLEALVGTDPLTGLRNRRGLDREVVDLWNDHRAEPGWASFVLIDIDHFKSFNDNYGHPAGDECLKRIARLIEGIAPGGDRIAARFGGEEFVVLLRDADFTTARRIAEEIRLAVVQGAIAHPVFGADAVVTISLGVASALTVDCDSGDLLARADQALYVAKKTGRNQVWPPVSAGASHSPPHCQDAAGADIPSTCADAPARRGYASLIDRHQAAAALS